MKKVLLMVIILMAASMMFATELQIGTGTIVIQHLPIEPYYGYSYSQTIYPNSEFPGSVMIITSVQYNYHNAGFSDAQSDDWIIYLGTTSQTNLDSGYEDIAQFTEVYNGNIGISQVPTGDGWIEITFDTPFTYNVADGENLIIAVEENTPGYSASSDDFYCTIAAGNVSRWYYSDNTNPDPTNPPSGTVSSYFPNIKFNISGDFSNPPTNLSATTNGTAIDLVWNNPTTNANGNPLTTLQQVVIERDGEIIATLDTTEPGIEMNYSDDFNRTVLNYTVYAVNSFGDGVPATISIDPIPSAPTNLTSTANGTAIDLVWNNPTTTASGNPLTTIQQIIVERDGEIITTFDSPTTGEELTYTDNFTIGGQFNYTYTVYGVNPFGDGVPATATINQWVGPSIQGLCLMSNTSDATGIKVKFTADPTTPSAITDSTFTNANGWYGIELTSGRYDISYTYTGYTPESTPNYFYDGTNVILEEKLIYPVANMQTISGDISGVLAIDTIYDVIADINVPANDSLVIGQNTSFFFREGVNFNIYGKIVAEGTTEQPIKFTNYPGENERGLIKLYAGNYDYLSVFSNCVFEMSNTHGLYLAENAQISWCKFNDNLGSGIYLQASSSHPIIRELTNIEYCEIYQNGSYGIYGDNNVSPTVDNCLINSNSSYGIYSGSNYDCSPHIKSSSIYQNQTTGIYCQDSTKVENCRIYENGLNNNCSAGIECNDNSQILFNKVYNNSRTGIKAYGNSYIYKNEVFSNVTSGIKSTSYSKIVSNTIVNNGGCGNISVRSSNCTIKNNIVRGSSVNFNNYSPTVTHNNFQSVQNAGNLPGMLNGQNTNANGTACDPYGNISEDPLFYDAANHNYHLTANSPCINAGDPNMELDPDGTVADMGAFYFDMNANSHAELQLPVSFHNFLGTIDGESRSWFCSILNSGTDNLEISSVEFDNEVFSIPTESRTEYPTDVSVAPGESYQMEVIFTPSEVGTFEGTMIINSNAFNQPAAEVQLYGSGIVNPDIMLTMNVNEHHNIMSSFDFPLNVSSTDGLNILSYNISISYDPNILTCNGVNSNATLSNGWSVNANTSTAGLVVIGAAGATALSGEGALCNLEFTVASGIEHDTSTFVNIENAVMNEGGTIVVGTFGSIIIDNVVYGDVDVNELVQAYDGALILQYSVMMDPLPAVDPRPWLDWRIARADVSGDGNVYAYDASLILQYILGYISEFPVESGNRNKNRVVDLICEVQDNAIIISSNDLSELFGCNINIPFIEGMQLGDVQFSDDISSYITNSFLDDNGLHVAIASANPLEASGTICYIPYISDIDSEIEISLIANDVSSSQNIHILSTLDSSDGIVPVINSISQNYPNPFNPTTTISYSVKADAVVIIEIYNVKGQLVKTLVNEKKEAGYHNVIWNGKDENSLKTVSGVYFYRVKIGKDFTDNKKMLLIK